MVKKAPRRTAERILDVTLDLFNRFGEPQVSTSLISAEVGISPGNLYYHYPAKDELIHSLLDKYESALGELLVAGQVASNVEDACSYVKMLFDLVWHYRFLYRDANTLLSKNHRLETHFQSALARKTRALQALLRNMDEAGALRMTDQEQQQTATSMVLILTYWLSLEYVRNPRNALEPESGQVVQQRGTQQVMGLLLPYLEGSQRMRLPGLFATPQS